MKKKTVKFVIVTLLVFTMVFSLVITAFGAQTKDYGKDTISEEDVLYVYDALYNGIVKEVPDETIEFNNLKSISEEEMTKAVELFISDHPECFWFRNHYSYRPLASRVLSITPNYSFEGDELTTAREEVENAVEMIMSGLPEGSNYDKALYLHDALAKRVVYEEVGEHQTVYGALVSGRAVCAGYAAAYQMLLEEAGITAWTVGGESRGVPHAWNAFWLDENTCVYADVTWDDQEDEIYHYYFGISKAEMEVDHTVNTDIFSLPECDHDDKSYFDVNDRTVNDSTSVSSFAAMFGGAIDNVRSAVIYFTGSDFTDWMSAHGSALYSELGGNGGSPSYSYKQIGKELHVSLTGNFPAMTYKVTVSGADNAYSNSETVQYVDIGEEMTPIIFNAMKGYYFPEDYSLDAVNGIFVQRIDAKTIKVWGTPTADNVSIALPAASKMTNEPTPNVIFTATGWDRGFLSGVKNGMRYSLDGTEWIDITSPEDIFLEGLTYANIYVVTLGDGMSTLDSEIQTIGLTRASVPSLTVTQPEGLSKKGIINTTEAHEYSLDGENWIDCDGALELDAGTYYIRVKANGSVLASNNLEVTVVYTAPEEPENDPDQTDPTDTPDNENNDEQNKDTSFDQTEESAEASDEQSTDQSNGTEVSDDSTMAEENEEEEDKTQENTRPEEITEGTTKGTSQKKGASCGLALEGEGAVLVIVSLVLCVATIVLRRKRKEF